MTKIDFYVLDKNARGDRHTLACRLAEKAWSQGHRVFLHTQSEQEAEHLERLLWTFRQESFLPHGLLGQVDPHTNPILIGSGEDPQDEHDVLINLTPKVPDFFSRFHRLVEPIDHSAESRDSGRERFRFYRDRGYPLNNHEIKQ